MEGVRVTIIISTLYCIINLRYEGEWRTLEEKVKKPRDHEGSGRIIHLNDETIKN